MLHYKLKKKSVFYEDTDIIKILYKPSYIKAKRYIFVFFSNFLKRVL